MKTSSVGAGDGDGLGDGDGEGLGDGEGDGDGLGDGAAQATMSGTTNTRARTTLPSSINNFFLVISISLIKNLVTFGYPVKYHISLPLVLSYYKVVTVDSKSS